MMKQYLGKIGSESWEGFEILTNTGWNMRAGKALPTWAGGD